MRHALADSRRRRQQSTRTPPPSLLQLKTASCARFRSLAPFGLARNADDYKRARACRIVKFDPQAYSRQTRANNARARAENNNADDTRFFGASMRFLGLRFCRTTLALHVCALISSVQERRRPEMSANVCESTRRGSMRSENRAPTFYKVAHWQLGRKCRRQRLACVTGVL